jgi:phage tail sheath protein FI
MPEYLAPGVYVEEIPSGNKPIQAASTSTAGMVGMTARGPVNQPTLVSSQGAYARIFGGYLNPNLFTAGRDALPYAAEGFFTNGGARLYLVRIVGAAATESTLQILAQDTSIDASPTLAAPAAAGDTTLVLSDPGAIGAGDTLLIADGEASETVAPTATAFEPRVRIDAGVAFDYSAGDAVTPQTLTTVAAALTAAAARGDATLTVDDSSRFTAGDVYLLSPAAGGATAELITVASIANATTVSLDAPLDADHPTTDTFASLTAGTATTLDAAVEASAARVLLEVASAAGITAGGVILLDNGTDSELAIVSGIASVVEIAAALAANHPADVALMPATRVMTAHARYSGAWGDALRLTAGPSSLVSTVLSNPEGATATSMVLDSAFGLFPGSVVIIDGRLSREVAAVDPTNGLVTLTAPHGEPLAAGMPVVSQEFSLTVERIENGRAAESETFERLSLASEHPRYALTQVGSWDSATGRPSESGGSNLIRLEDNADGTTRRLPLVTGVPRVLDGGNDDVAGVTDTTYVGTPSDDPIARTGIQALENEPTLSMVAVPGQVSVTVQKALVAHCERMRYRFCVLDTPIGANLQQARTHRQNFDNTRTAIYYPALEIADRFGAPGERRVIPPSGHILGVYARTDLTRGVHKAPANEVIRGILSFDNKLDKGAQDILNPINLNCLRDFRTENRGLRVFGARVATSDPEWRYINVRRLLLFIEQSLDTGLQWAVFEINDKPLWDTVKQSITNFLTTVWRSGALEGQKAEEAFFVNIGYDVTMTQEDIDQGRLIVEIGVAPVKPAEFVIVRISQKTREATS